MKINRKVRSFLFIISIITTVCFLGCAGKKKEESKKQDDFDIKIATNVVENYMNLLLKNDLQGVKKYYSKELIKSAKENTNNELNMRGYKITDVNEFGKSGLFKIRVVRDNNASYACLDEYNVKVEKEGEDYKIKEATNIIQRESFQENNELRIKIKNNADTNLLINKDGIPSYAFTRDDGANIIKTKVPKKNFKAMCFSYSGDGIALSLNDKDSYIGIVKIDESIATQGDGAGDEGKGGGKDEGTKKDVNAKEKPVGKEVSSLDIIKDSTVDFILFSQDEKFVVVQYSKSNAINAFRVYSVENGDLIPYKVEEIFPLDKVSVLFSSFDKENLIFNITPKTSSDKSLNNIVGKWQLNLKEVKGKKL